MINGLDDPSESRADFGMKQERMMYCGLLPLDLQAFGFIWTNWYEMLEEECLPC